MTYADMKIIEAAMKEKVEALRKQMREANIAGDNSNVNKLEQEVREHNIVLQHIYGAKMEA